MIVSLALIVEYLGTLLDLSKITLLKVYNNTIKQKNTLSKLASQNNTKMMQYMKGCNMVLLFHKFS